MKARARTPLTIEDALAHFDKAAAALAIPIPEGFFTVAQWARAKQTSTVTMRPKLRRMVEKGLAEEMQARFGKALAAYYRIKEGA